MTEQERIEHSIRDSLAKAKNAHALSDALFHPTGLFARLATTVEARRALVCSSLFLEAQRRLSELQRQEGPASRTELEQATTQGQK